MESSSDTLDPIDAADMESLQLQYLSKHQPHKYEEHEPDSDANRLERDGRVSRVDGDTIIDVTDTIRAVSGDESVRLSISGSRRSSEWPAACSDRDTPIYTITWIQDCENQKPENPMQHDNQSWNQRKIRVWMLICFLSCIGATVTALIFFYLLNGYSNLNIITKKIIDSVNETLDPCDNFYNFVCDKWIQNNPLSEGDNVWGVTYEIDTQNQIVLRQSLEHADISNPQDAEAKARFYYEACMDTNNRIEELGEKPLLNIIKQLGGWKLLPNTMVGQSKRNLQQLIQDVHNEYNMKSLFYWDVRADDRNSSKHVISLDQVDHQLLTRDQYLNKSGHQEVFDAYLDYMTKICVLLGANESEAKIQMSKVIQFETELANITAPAVYRRNKETMYKNYTITQWQAEAPFLNWTMFFNHVFKQVNQTVSDTETIVVYASDYFKKLVKLLEKYKNIDKEHSIITNYMMWQLSCALADYLPKSFRNADKSLKKKLGGITFEKSWIYCVMETNKALGFATGAMFVREVFHGQAKVQAIIMMYNIRNAFKHNINNSDWLDAETKEAIQMKIDSSIALIGYPEYILNKDKLNKQYEALEVKPDEYFQNIIAFHRFSLRNNLKKLHKSVNRAEWKITPSTANAYYSLKKNHIAFPAGILQQPIFSENYPAYVNYGATGANMAHELTHGFDDEGRKFDRFGNLKQWWNNDSIVQFGKRAECFEKQYSSFTIDGYHLNGKLTLGENIADNGGLKASYHAYLEYSKHVKNEDLMLPEMKYNHEQLFFISFAQTWCSSMKKKLMMLQIDRDVHTLSMYRVNAVLMNFKQFSKAFHCPLGSKMNPKDKCEVW